MLPSLDLQADEIITEGAQLADVMSDHFDDVPRCVCAMAVCMLAAQLITHDQDKTTDGVRIAILVEEIIKCVGALRQVDPCTGQTLQ